MEVEIAVPMSRERKYQLQRIAARRRRPLCRVLGEFINWRAIEKEAHRSTEPFEEPATIRRRRVRADLTAADAVEAAEAATADLLASRGTLRDRRHG